MAKRVRRDLIGIKPGALSGAAKRFADRVDVACGASWGREHPFATRRQHVHALSQIFGQFTRDRLLTRPRLRLRNPDHSLADIDVFSADRKNFRMAHPCVQSDHDESVDVLIVIRCCCFQQSKALIIRQVDDPLDVFFETHNLEGFALDPLPFNRLVYEMG